MARFTPIAVNPDQMGGVPCVRGPRVPVSGVAGMGAGGMAQGEVLEAYPGLEPEDIREALAHATPAVWEGELPLAQTP